MQGHGIEKFRDTDLICTSSNRAWTLISAEIRSHKAGEIGAFTPQNAEITQVIGDTKQALSTRSSGGVCQEVTTIPGSTWLCPAGIEEEATRLSDDFPETLHIYIPQHSFLNVTKESGLTASSRNLRYQYEVSNFGINKITKEVVRELYDETSSGGLKIDSLSVDLIRTLSIDHMEASPSRRPLAFAKGSLDSQRLDRVLEYIEANLEGDISVIDLADAACFSLFHFSRAFHSAMGRPPHAYLSERRLDRAKHMLAYSDNSLVDVSLTCRFSGQANFTKAFKRAVGISPGRYRRAHR
ncbi:MAG: AraC family transcriptional regulator [Novosphingobium sp.]|nr:AraC family transcriptional regulator [Novosphingobium sp.]